MKILEYHYFNTVETDLILTDHINSSFILPKFKKIIVSTGGENSTENYVMSSLFILDFISKQKPTITCSKKDNLVVGGKVTLRKSKMFLFLFTLLFEILPNIKSFEGFNPPCNKDTFMFTIKDIILLKGLSVLVPLIDNSSCFIKIQLFTTAKDRDQLFKLGRLSLVCFL